MSGALQPCVLRYVQHLRLRCGLVQESARSESFHNVPMLA